MFNQFDAEFFKEMPSKVWVILALAMVNTFLLAGVAWFATQEIYIRIIG